MQTKTFGEYFKANMDALGMPTPLSLFDSVERAARTISIISGIVSKFGPRATLMEVARTAPTLSVRFMECAQALSGILASAYIGACIGSAAVALGRVTSGGLTIADLFSTADKMGVPRTPATCNAYRSHVHETMSRPQVRSSLQTGA